MVVKGNLYKKKKKKRKRKKEYFVTVINGKTIDSFITNLMEGSVISSLVWGLLSFPKISREVSVIYPKERIRFLI